VGVGFGVFNEPLVTKSALFLCCCLLFCSTFETTRIEQGELLKRSPNEEAQLE
jgi:hypothetical protein